MTTCSITSPRYDFYICSAYSDINNNNIPVKLQELADFCVRKNKELVCGIDTNAHSHLWGSPKNNARGDMYELFLAGAHLNLLNIGNDPTFVRGNV